MKRLALLVALGTTLGVPLQAQLNANNARGFDAEKVYQIGDIDHINVFNGNLLVTLPIGQKYRVSDHLSWGLTLVYNGNPWNYRVTQNSEPIPSRFMNAGLGWQLGFGELVGPNDTLSTSMGVAGSWVYAAPDGAERTFLPRLHAEERGTAFEAPANPGVGGVAGYTRDSSYLRLVRIGPRFVRDASYHEQNPNPPPPLIFMPMYIFVAEYQIEFPDGTRHTLTSGQYADDTMVPDPEYEKSLRYRVTKMEDRFGNSVTIDYTDNDNAHEPSATWTIKENAGTTLLRTHTVTVGTDTFTQLGFSTQSRRRVDSVSLTAFDGKVVTYTFGYSGNKTISTPCVAAYNPPPKTAGNFLESVSATETTGGMTTTLFSYSMQYYDVITDSDGNVVCSQHAGHLKSIGLPTGGSIAYSAGMRLFPSEKTGDGTGGPGLHADISAAVETRTVTNTNGTKEITAYKSHLHTPVTYVDSDNKPRSIPTQMTVAVSDPLGHVTYNHFSVARIGGNSSCFPDAPTSKEYGLPFLRITGTKESDLFLSSETYENTCTTFALNGCKPACKSAAGSILTPVRRGYVKYDLDTSESSLDLSRPPAYNQRVSASRTQFVDSSCGSATCYTEMRLTDFDGLGHYRKDTRSSNFPITASRGTETSYNANTSRGTYTPGGNSAASAYMIASDGEWLLNLHDQVKVTQGTTSAATQLCFDRTTGFLDRRRVLSGTTAGSTDLLTVLTNSAGNVDSEALYGGDVAPLDGAMADGCADSPGTASYEIDHSYEFGVRKSSEYVLTATTKLSALDLTIDGNTGLPKESRDTASVTTTYEYDVLGRLSKVKPTGEAWTRYNYDLVGRPASVVIETFATTVTDVTDTTERLAHRRLYYDGLGRLVQTRDQLPVGWTVTESTYDLLGRKKTLSVAVAATSGDYTALAAGTRTTAFEYDQFGRPTRVLTPDGKRTGFTYEGTRIVKRTVDVGGTDATTTETYDGHGRLIEVKEGPVIGGSTTSYGYDLGDRLTSVAMFDQTREFTYDGRGLLLYETHPETGSLGNGTTYYGTFNGTEFVPAYDARGRMTRRIVETANGGHDLKYSYDRAERLTTVEDIDPNTRQRRTLESFEYAPANDGIDLRKGKLVTATRNNYTGDFGKIEVKETYKYQNPAGRPTGRETTVTGTASFTGAAFTLGQTWNELGQLSTVTYPSTASMAAPMRTITNTYSAGRLTGVVNYATLSYQATGLIDTVTHGTGSSAVNEKWTADPHGMARPAKIEVTGNNLTTWTYGDYAYDGAGNITKIGTRTFSYDALNRLTGWRDTKANGDYTAASVTYDPFGNHVLYGLSGVFTVGAQKTVYSSSSRPYEIDPLTNHTVGETYDDAGSVVADGRHTYGYDATGMLVSIDGSGRKDRYLYTADRERIAIIDAQMNRTTWTLRGTGNNLLRTFTRAGLTGGSWSWTEDEIWRGGQLLARETATGRQRYHLDHLGSPRLVTDAFGFRAGEQQFQPFGFGGTNDGGRLQFTGHERDVVRWPGVHRALDYQHARFYDPAMGRFLSVDPALDMQEAQHEPQLWNRYSYVTNNPLKFTDPDGRYRTFYKEKPIHTMGNNAPPVIAAAMTAPAAVLGVGAAFKAAPLLSRFGMAVSMRFPAIVDAARNWLQGETGTPNAAAIGTRIGQSLAGQANQMGSIVEQVSAANLSQTAAATAAENAVLAIGKGTAGIVKVGTELVVTSRRGGANQYVLIVDKAGKVAKGFATIEFDSNGNTVVSNLERAK